MSWANALEVDGIVGRFHFAKFDFDRENSVISWLIVVWTLNETFIEVLVIRLRCFIVVYYNFVVIASLCVCVRDNKIIIKWYYAYQFIIRTVE